MLAFPFQRIAIIGLGLMGGSLALALRARGFAGTLLGAGGSDPDLQGAAAAVVHGVPVFDQVEQDPASLPLVETDLLILAVPPLALPQLLQYVAQATRSNTVVTDLASVKAEHVRHGESLLGHRFLSSHPLIGAEQKGFVAARAELYRNYRCVLCPSAQPNTDVLTRLRQFWQTLGAEVLEMSAEAHDRALAATSHLPHLLAFAYLEMLGDAEEDLRLLAGSGLRDFSRIAASDPQLWADILEQNRSAVRADLQRFQEQLARLDAHLATGDRAGLAASLARGQRARSQFHFPSG
ncbi:MAG: prephenate dehydrogenase/arogenate dehydrogenase family protein [Candidatus Igneacidithiobacillus chanchocoensis]